MIQYHPNDLAIVREKIEYSMKINFHGKIILYEYDLVTYCFFTLIDDKLVLYAPYLS